MLGALVQQQSEQILRLQHVMDERRRQRRRRDRAVWVRPWIKEIDEILLCGSNSFSTTSRSGMTLKQRRRNYSHAGAWAVCADHRLGNARSNSGHRLLPESSLAMLK